MEKIRWDDLGRKFMVSRGKKSMVAHANESIYPYDEHNLNSINEAAGDIFIGIEP